MFVLPLDSEADCDVVKNERPSAVAVAVGAAERVTAELNDTVGVPPVVATFVRVIVNGPAPVMAEMVLLAWIPVPVTSMPTWSPAV